MAIEHALRVISAILLACGEDEWAKAPELESFHRLDSHLGVEFLAYTVAYKDFLVALQIPVKWALLGDGVQLGALRARQHFSEIDEITF